MAREVRYIYLRGKRSQVEWPRPVKKNFLTLASMASKTPFTLFRVPTRGPLSSSFCFMSSAIMKAVWFRLNGVLWQEESGTFIHVEKDHK